MKKWFCSVLAIFMVMLLFAGCKPADNNTEKENESDSVKIAFVGPLTGDNADIGKQMQTGVELAIQQWNEKGGVIGKEITLEVFDDKNDATEAGNIAERITSDDAFVAVIGHFSSGVAMTAAEIYQDAGIPLINGSAAHVDYSSIGDCIFRNNTVYNIDASSAIQIIEHFGYDRFAMIQPNSDAGVSISNCVHTFLEKYDDKINAQLVAEELYEDGTVDFSAAINKFIEADTQIVYTTAPYSIVGPLMNQYRAVDPEIVFVLSSGAFSQELLDLAGENANGSAGKTQFDETGDCPKEQVCLLIDNGNWTEVPDVLVPVTEWEASMA